MCASYQQHHIWLRTTRPDSDGDTRSGDQEQNGKEEEEVEHGKEEEMEEWVDDVTACDFSINKHE